jgi:molybdenum cofactor cytidylyltransferase
VAKIAAVVLAAGASSRFGTENKLLAPVADKPLVERVVREVLRGPVGEVVVVTGCQHAAVERALAELPVLVTHNADWQAGMGSSIAAGVRALEAGTDAAFIVPGDMPFLRADLLSTLAAALQDGGRTTIVYPATTEGEQRNPVLWPSRFFAQLCALTGREGAKRLLRQLQGDTHAVIVADATAFADIDTPADLESARAQTGGSLAT